LKPEVTIAIDRSLPRSPLSAKRLAWIQSLSWARLRRSWSTGLLMAVTGLVAAFMLWPRLPIDLGRGDNVLQAGLYAHWQAGEVVALVRHAERCDRAPGPCLAEADGITVAGDGVARQLRSAFGSLGLARTDVFSSPLTRTVQTADTMLDQQARIAPWLRNCKDTIAEQLRLHKADGRNLVASTHNTCMNELITELGFSDANEVEYASTLFATLGKDGKLHLLGFIDPQQWPHVIAGNAAL
jgi:phosphohistidine phosphatase SixA